MKNCDILLTGAYLLTQNEKREVVTDAALAITGTIIDAIGSTAELEKQYTPKVRRDLGNALIMPGLVNAHTHVPMTLLRGMADDLPLMEWLTKHIFPLEAKLTPHMIEVGTALACAEMLRTGTTAFMDMYMFERSVYKSIDNCGVKAVVGEGIFDVPTEGNSDLSRSIEIVREHVEELKGNKRIRYAVMPHSVYTTNLPLLEQCAALSEELGLPLHVHLAETVTETAQSIEMYGERPVAVALKAGLLTSKTTIAHGVDLNDDEIRLLAEKGVSLAHCPRSNMKLSSGISPLPKLLKKGVNVALGTDGASSNNMLNMFCEMSSAALLHKVDTLNPTELPASDVLDIATINGGKALGWKGLGKLVVGGSADLTALDLTAPNLVPMTSVPSHVVYAATGHEVFFTMIDGEVLYDKGAFSRIDYPALAKEAQDIRNWLASSR